MAVRQRSSQGSHRNDAPSVLAGRAMGRRAIGFALALILVAPALAAEAQDAGKVWRIGYLAAGPVELDRSWLAALQQGLRDLGYVEGKNIVIERRHAAGRVERLPELIAELVRLKVDVFVVYGSPAIDAAKKATSTIPIVMTVHADPVGAGLVASLSRPGGNVTGLSDLHAGTVTKRLELLKEAVHMASRVAVLLNPTNPTSVLQLKDLQAAAPALGVTVLSLEVKGPADIDRAFATIGKERLAALLVLAEPTVIGAHRRQIADLAVKRRIATIGTVREFADAGFLMSYGTNFHELWRRAATYVDKILKGANPGDLPIEQASKWELVINRKTATALGVTIPPSVLLRVDHVIE